MDKLSELIMYLLNIGLIVAISLVIVCGSALAIESTYTAIKKDFNQCSGLKEIQK